MSALSFIWERTNEEKKWSSEIIFDVLPIRFQQFLFSHCLCADIWPACGARRGEAARREKSAFSRWWINKAIAGGAWPALIARIKRIAFTNDAFQIGRIFLLSRLVIFPPQTIASESGSAEREGAHTKSPHIQFTTRTTSFIFYYYTFDHIEQCARCWCL